MSDRPGRPLGSKDSPKPTSMPENLLVQTVPALMTMKEVACVLGLTYQAFRNQRKKDPSKLPQPIKVGGVYRYRAYDVDGWIRSQPFATKTGT